MDSSENGLVCIGYVDRGVSISAACPNRGIERERGYSMSVYVRGEARPETAQFEYRIEFKVKSRKEV